MKRRGKNKKTNKWKRRKNGEEAKAQIDRKCCMMDFSPSRRACHCQMFSTLKTSSYLARLFLFFDQKAQFWRTMMQTWWVAAHHWEQRWQCWESLGRTAQIERDVDIVALRQQRCAPSHCKASDTIKQHSQEREPQMMAPLWIDPFEWRCIMYTDELSSRLNGFFLSCSSFSSSSLPPLPLLFNQAPYHQSRKDCLWLRKICWREEQTGGQRERQRQANNDNTKRWKQHLDNTRIWKQWKQEW